MDRPRSAASSAAAPSHQRQPSAVKNGFQSKPLTSISPLSSVIALFVTNLRLLDLDLLPDCPQINVQSFGNQDARLRIKCTEYALYHLFHIYDPATTADKLQPFFPPLEPLQSVNLRAALYRCLNDLKKSGGLSREAVLRKTMLDDCQGDKFWEVCLAFSATVLRKRTFTKKRNHSNSLAGRLSLATSVSKSEKESMLPLAIAHRASLHRVLQEKAKKRESQLKLSNLLKDKEAELQERKVRAQEHVPTAVDPERLRAVEQAIEKSWIGSAELKEALIGGDVCARGDGLLLRSFDNLWKSHTRDGDVLQSNSSAETGFLEGLRNDVSVQNRRLRKWQNFHDKLVAAKPRSTQSSNRSSVSVKPVVRFDRHRDLTMRDTSPHGEKGRQQTHERHDSVLKYDEILTAMRDELRKTVANQGPPATTVAIPPIRRAQTQPVASARMSVIPDPPPRSHGHQRSPSQTAVPMWPRMGTRTPSRSKSYQQPKVISQREPIPLKSELFSPLKDKRQSSASNSSLLASPAEDGDAARGFDRSSSAGLAVDRATLARLSGEDSSTGNGGGLLRRENPRSSLSRSVDQDSGYDSSTSRPALIESTHTAPVPAIRPSLAERTRMSMVFNPNHFESDTNTTPRGPHNLCDASASPSPSPSEKQSPLLSHSNTFSLAERTRQSIFLAPQPSSNPSISKSSRQTKKFPVYPIKPFDTPTKPRQQSSLDPVDSVQPSSSPSTSETGEEDEDEDEERRDGNGGASLAPTPRRGRRDVTPLEQLLSPEAEYDSVFKSRPRVVHSPRSRSTAELESVG